MTAMNQDASDAAIAAASASAAVASKFTYSGSLAVVGGWLVSSEAAVVGGLVIGLVGLAVQWYYRHREFKLKEREFNARMAARGFYDAGDA